MPSNKYMAEYMRNYRAKNKEFYEMEKIEDRPRIQTEEN